ncbi:MAG: hypothetical protein V3W45_03910 [Sedimentisphaerales bacterium]
MEGWLRGLIIIIVGLYYVLVGILCLFIPNYIKNWINKQSVTSLRLLGVLIIFTGVLIISQLLIFGKLFHLLITLAEP